MVTKGGKFRYSVNSEKQSIKLRALHEGKYVKQCAHMRVFAILSKLGQGGRTVSDLTSLFSTLSITLQEAASEIKVKSPRIEDCAQGAGRRDTE